MVGQLQRICDLIKYEMRWYIMPTATWHIPSSFKKEGILNLSMLHLMHSWAQLRRQSLSVSTYSCLLQPIWLQWVSSLVRVLTCHNYCGNHGHSDHQVELALRRIQWPNNVDRCIGCHVGLCSCVTRTTQISGCTRLVPEVLYMFRHQLCVECDVTAACFPHQC